MSALDALRAEAAAFDELALEKGRRKAGEMHPDHAALHAHIDAVYHSPKTTPEVRVALGRILDHSDAIVAPAKPARVPKPKPALRQDVVDHHVAALRSASGGVKSFRGAVDGGHLQRFTEAHARLGADPRVRKQEMMAIAGHIHNHEPTNLRTRVGVHDFLLHEHRTRLHLHDEGELAAKARPW